LCGLNPRAVGNSALPVRLVRFEVGAVVPQGTGLERVRYQLTIQLWSTAVDGDVGREAGPIRRKHALDDAPRSLRAKGVGHLTSSGQRISTVLRLGVGRFANSLPGMV